MEMYRRLGEVDRREVKKVWVETLYEVLVHFCKPEWMYEGMGCEADLPHGCTGEDLGMALVLEWNVEDRLRAKNAFDGSLVYGTGAFNRLTGRDRHLDQRQRVRDFFTDPKTGSLKNEICEKRTCPKCQGDEKSELFVKDGFPHVRCLSCQLVYVTPIISEEAVMKFYAEESSWTEVLFSEEQIETDKRKFDYGLQLIEARKILVEY